MKKELLTIEQGMERIAEIMGDAPVINKKEIVGETVVIEHGAVVAVNGKSVVAGYKKGKRIVNRAAKSDLIDAVEVLLSKHITFGKKMFKHRTEGIVIRMADADYTIKTTAHTRKDFENREEDFKPSISFATRGSATNHTGAIARYIFEKIEDVEVLDAKASGIRVEYNKQEVTIKLVKKRARVNDCE